ncbi:substrate-binding domain-containing protein [Planosporangium thailandense]|uniref:Substrate-binding domain-containing protein n=2 Tax=Planosporangium thailandense TaxID=765197 RepID=A0ABX0Y5S9_9ACTN|nr:substrate-binding domain-containing protein [Planosporangium thailandense]NJC72910.1 substrate-binding domain-containing protein [Planosporangium thailandense]
MNEPESTGGLSRRGILGIAGGVAASFGLAACTRGKDSGGGSGSTSGAQGSGTYYWISHGAPNDQVHVIANKGATRAGKDLGVTVRTSLHNNDIPSHQQAIQSAIAAKATGIATSIPQAKVFNDLIKQATDAGIPVVTFNQDEPDSERVAYVGADLKNAGAVWAHYLVDNNLVKPGDKVWLPVEVAGASYQVLETEGAKSVFAEKNISVDVFQAGGDPAASLTAMRNYLTAHRDVNAIIGLGDSVMGNVPQALQGVGATPGKIPVVGWGNNKATAEAVKAGWVNAALWQFPDTQGYMPIVILNMLHNGLAGGYDITSQALYTKKNVANFERFVQ